MVYEREGQNKRDFEGFRYRDPMLNKSFLTFSLLLSVVFDFKNLKILRRIWKNLSTSTLWRIAKATAVQREILEASDRDTSIAFLAMILRVRSYVEDDFLMRFIKLSSPQA